MTARRRWILAARAATRAGRALARTGYPQRAAVYYGYARFMVDLCREAV